ncbi:MAG: tripartite tricarboxylate transporter permease [Dehalococcoidia bacterium]
MLEAYSEAASQLFTPLPMLALFAGVALGLVSGAMPAGGLPVLVVLLGFAYYLDPFIAIPIAIGHMAVNGTSDTIPSVLLGIPGSNSSQATILDGYPMAQKGLAGQALAAAYTASVIGGIIGAIGLALSIPVAKIVLRQFGSPEFFMMGMVGIAIVGVVSSGALVKGLLSAAFAMAISTVGYDVVTGITRFTFGNVYLYDGFPLIPVIVGLFAIPELLNLIVSDSSVVRKRADAMVTDVNKGRGEGIRAAFRYKFLVLRSSLIGLFVGMLPGVGGTAAHWMAYASARQTEPGAEETFGTGDIRGVIAPESANNSIDGGVLIPTLTLGIPGSGGTAIMLGFFILLGITPGPDMLEQHLDITALIALSLVLANIIAAGVALLLTPQLAKISLVRPNVLVPIVLAVLTISAFQATRSVGDLVVVGLFTGLGVFMKRYGWPRPPIIVALVLSPQLSKYMWISLNTYGASMLLRPQSGIILAVAVVSVAFTLRSQMRLAQKQQEMVASSMSAGGLVGPATLTTEDDAPDG